MILLVDDDPDVRRMISVALKGEGYEIKTADNGRGALYTLTNLKPSLIVLDMMMPEMNGLEFCKQLIKYRMTGVPILVLSAVSPTSSLVKQFLELPFEKREFIQKPFIPAAFLKRVVDLIGPPNSKAAPTAPVQDATMEPAVPESAPSHVSVAAQPAREPAPVPPVSAERMRVLVIDDDDDIRTFLRLALSPKVEVADASDGMTGLSLMERFEPDFIICDIMMPGMNGFETVAAIRSHPEFYQIPVFFLSGEKHPELPQMSKEAGANLFLPKPIDPTRLLELMDYFIQEMGIAPRSRATPTVAIPVPESKPTVRVLVIDSNVDNVAIMKDILNDPTDGEWETLWSEEPRVALGQLGRLQPDLILYNPRQKVMEGAAFVQFLQLKKMLGQFEIAFIGKDFLPSDVEYSKHELSRPVISLSQPVGAIRLMLKEPLRAAAVKSKPKRFTIAQIKAGGDGTESKEHSAGDHLREERERMREKYRKIQAEIDKQRW